MKISIGNKTKFYALIGDPIAHSLSPLFQNYLIQKKNIDAVYIPLKVSPLSLKYNLELLRDNFAGFNVTIPHKESIMQYLDEIDPLAIEYGAVNTVKVNDGKFIGYNTDGLGFTSSLKNTDINFKGKEILLLGAGGAAKVIASEIIKLGGNLTITNRNIDRGIYIKEELQKLYNIPINIVQLENIHASFDIIINSTSVGMHPNIDESPVDSNILQGVEFIYDVIYNPFKTRLLELGNKLGAKTMNGLPMLICQGIKSFEIWTEKKASHNEEREIYNMLKDIFNK